MAVNLSPVGGAAAQFFNNDGTILSGGKIYTYAAGTTTPVATYTTSAGNIAHANPIILNSAGRVSSGEIWLTEGTQYKFVLNDANDASIATWDNLYGISSLTLPISSVNVTYNQGSTGAVTSTVQAKLRESVSVLDFINPSLHASIAAGTYTGDLSTQVQNAFNIGTVIFFPAGTYLFNVVATKPFILDGDGTTTTYIKPFNYTEAIINYDLPNGGESWSYDTILRSVTFEGASGTLITGGVGFTYGSTDPTVYSGLDSFIGFVTFDNCRFRFLYKGIQRPSGNLALQLTNCNFSSCYYGTYNVQGKGFPPGQFFLLNGETNSCLCGHYFDVQQGGLGQVSSDGHVFEANSICFRAKQPTTDNLYTSIMFRDCWNEVNGLYRPGGPSTVTLDVWSGTGSGATRTTEVVSCEYPYVMSVNQIEWNGGFCAGFILGTASNCLMKINSARVECNSATNSSPFYINPADDGTCILMENCVTAGGFPPIYNCVDFDRNRCLDVGTTGTAARARYLQQMWNIATGTKQIGFNQTFQSAQTLSNGSGVVATGSVSTDNAIYSNVNNFAYNSPTGNQQYNFSNTQVTLGTGYYVVTFQLVATNLGSLVFNVWNAGAAPYIVSLAPIVDSDWHTYGGIAYYNTSLTVNLGGTSNDASAVGVNFSISAYQIKRFNTLVQAEDFLYSRTYLA